MAQEFIFSSNRVVSPVYILLEFRPLPVHTCPLAARFLISKKAIIGFGVVSHLELFCAPYLKFLHLRALGFLVVYELEIHRHKAFICVKDVGLGRKIIVWIASVHIFIEMDEFSDFCHTRKPETVRAWQHFYETSHVIIMEMGQA
jgi:hypothetical protein